jgi:hypothetical protein
MTNLNFPDVNNISIENNTYNNFLNEENIEKLSEEE